MQYHLLSEDNDRSWILRHVVWYTGTNVSGESAADSICIFVWLIYLKYNRFVL